jgi:hypothetical protein
MTAMKELRTAQALLEEHASEILKEVDAAPIFLKGEYNYRVIPRFGRRGKQQERITHFCSLIW